MLLFVDISHTSWRKSQVYDDVDAYIRLSTPNECSVSLFSYQIFLSFRSGGELNESVNFSKTF